MPNGTGRAKSPSHILKNASCAFVFFFITPHLFGQSPSRLSDSLSGLATTSKCSGVLIRLSNDPNGLGVILMAGHCMGLIKSNTYKSGPLEWPQDVALYSREGKASWMQVRRILYQSMTGADIALLELNATYRKLTRLGIDSYEISSEPGKPGDLIFMRKVSSPQIQSCAIEKVIPRLKARQWEWLRTYRYTACETHDGDSGAPLISAATGKVIGVHDIQSVDENLKRTIFEFDELGRAAGPIDARYGQSADKILTCVTPEGIFDLNAPSCKLFK